MMTFSHLKLLVLLLLSGTGFSSLAQTQNLQFEHLTVKNELLHNDVRCIIQDHKGYLWFGTSQGLNKYDGNGFTAYKFDPQDSTSLVNNMILGLWEDKEGDIWVGTTEATCRFDRRTERFTRFAPDSTNPFALKHVGAFNEDATGTKWMGNFEKQLRQVDPKTGKFSAVNYGELLYPPGNNTPNITLGVHTIYKDKAGTLWIGSGSGLHKMHLTPQGKGKPVKVSFTSYQYEPENANSLSHNNVVSIWEDHAGVLWIGTQGGGLNALNRKTGAFTRYRYDASDSLSISNDRVSRQAIAEDQEGNLWIGTRDGLNKLNKERTHFTRYFHNPKNPASLSSNYVYSLMVDRAGILWVATIGGGVSKVDPHRKPFMHYQHIPDDPHSLSNNKVNSICEDQQGTIWIGTVGGGLNAWDKKTGNALTTTTDRTMPAV